MAADHMDASANPEAAIPEAQASNPQETQALDMKRASGSHVIESQQQSRPRSGGKLFIGGISWDTKTEDLIEHFKNYGTIIDAVVMKDRATGRPRGFGFVTFEDPAACDKVVEDQHEICGRTVEAKKSVPQDHVTPAIRGPRTKKIFVGGLAGSTTEEEFKDYFTSFGNVVDQQIMMDHSTGRSRGFGFVTFDNDQSVENVLAQGKMHQLGNKQVEVKKAEPRRSDASGGNDGFNGRVGRYGGEYSSGGYEAPNYEESPAAGYRNNYAYSPGYPGAYAVPYGAMYMGSGGYRPYSGYGDAYGGEGQGYANGPFNGAMGATSYMPNGGAQYGGDGYGPPSYLGGPVGAAPADYGMGAMYAGGPYGAYPASPYGPPPPSPGQAGFQEGSVYPGTGQFHPYG